VMSNRRYDGHILVYIGIHTIHIARHTPIPSAAPLTQSSPSLPAPPYATSMLRILMSSNGFSLCVLAFSIL
jgi:hypothetical protein